MTALHGRLTADSAPVLGGCFVPCAHDIAPLWFVTHDDVTLEVWNRRTAATPKGAVARLSAADLLGDTAVVDADDVAISHTVVLTVAQRQYVAVCVVNGGTTALFLFDPLQEEIVVVPTAFLEDMVTAVDVLRLRELSADVAEKHVSDVLVLGCANGFLTLLQFNERLGFKRLLSQVFEPASGITALAHFRANHNLLTMAVGFAAGSMAFITADFNAVDLPHFSLQVPTPVRVAVPVTAIAGRLEQLFVGRSSTSDLRRYGTSVSIFRFDAAQQAMVEADGAVIFDHAANSRISAMTATPDARILAVALDQFGTAANRVTVIQTDQTDRSDMVIPGPPAVSVAMDSRGRLVHVLQTSQFTTVKRADVLPMPEPTAAALELQMVLRLFEVPHVFDHIDKIRTSFAARRAALDGQLFIDLLLSTLKLDTALYPPISAAHLRDLLQKAEQTEFDSLRIHCILFYLLLDLQSGAFSPDPVRSRPHEDFAEQVGLPSHYMRLIAAYWLLDHSTDSADHLQLALDKLMDPMVTANWTAKILATFIKQRRPDLALRLVLSGRAPIQQTASGIADSEYAQHLSVYLVNDRVANAIAFWRAHRSAPNGDALFVRILDHIFHGPLDRSKKLQILLDWSLDEHEDSLLLTYLRKPATNHETRAIMVLFLVSRARYIEAIREFAALPSSAEALISMLRDVIVANISKIVPAVQLQLLSIPAQKTDVRLPPAAVAPLVTSTAPAPLSASLRAAPATGNAQQTLIRLLQLHPLPSQDVPAKLAPPTPARQPTRPAAEQMDVDEDHAMLTAEAPPAAIELTSDLVESPVFIRSPAKRSSVDLLRTMLAQHRDDRPPPAALSVPLAQPTMTVLPRPSNTPATTRKARILAQAPVPSPSPAGRRTPFSALSQPPLSQSPLSFSFSPAMSTAAYQPEQQQQLLAQDAPADDSQSEHDNDDDASLVPQAPVSLGDLSRAQAISRSFSPFAPPPTSPPAAQAQPMPARDNDTRSPATFSTMPSPFSTMGTPSFPNLRTPSFGRTMDVAPLSYDDPDEQLNLTTPLRPSRQSRARKSAVGQTPVAQMQVTPSAGPTTRSRVSRATTPAAEVPNVDDDDAANLLSPGPSRGAQSRPQRKVRVHPTTSRAGGIASGIAGGIVTRSKAKK